MFCDFFSSKLLKEDFYPTSSPELNLPAPIYTLEGNHMVQSKVSCPQYNNLSQDLSELKRQLIDLESRALTVRPTQFLCQLYSKKSIYVDYEQKIELCCNLADWWCTSNFTEISKSWKASQSIIWEHSYFIVRLVKYICIYTCIHAADISCQF